jgi:soluble lytic murein transglycosylase-like protein
MKTSILTIVSLAALIIVLIAPQGALADFYKYEDNNGVVHLTNVPTSAKYRWFMRESGKALSTLYFFDKIITGASSKWGIDPSLVKAVIKAESDFDPHAVSKAGARGLMQLMPETARLMGVNNLDDPEENVEGGIRYLKYLLKRFNWNVPLALAAYNAGEDAVRKYGGIPPYKETRRYVEKVLIYRKIFGGSSTY